MKKFILETLFPQFCLACNKQGALICADCLTSIEIASKQCCPFCDSALLFGKTKCSKHSNKNLNGLFAATSYQQSLVKKLISRLKYSPYAKNLSLALAFLIISHLLLTENKQILQTGENSVLAPIPLFKRKQRKRGFNQAELIAQELAKALNLPLLTDNLIKIKKTQAQVSLTKEQRAENIKDAFALKNPQAFHGKKVLLIDDVFTTGATMEETAKTLKQAGASEVWAITASREPLSN